MMIKLTGCKLIFISGGISVDVKCLLMVIFYPAMGQNSARWSANIINKRQRGTQLGMNSIYTRLNPSALAWTGNSWPARLQQEQMAKNVVTINKYLMASDKMFRYV